LKIKAKILRGLQMADENGVVTEGGMDASTESSVPADAGDSSADVNWSDMALEMENGDDGEALGAVEGDTEVVETSENVTPFSSEPTAAPATPAVQAPPVAPVEPTPQVIPPQPAAQPQGTSQEPPAQPQQSYNDWRTGQLTGLEKHYAFDDETSAKLLTEPEVVLPQLAAKLHMEVVEHAVRSVMAAMPQWVEQHNSARTRESSAEQLFYGTNPDLKDPAYRTAVFQMGQAYRAMNPSAPAEEAVRVIGNMVRTAMGLSQPQPPAGSTVVQSRAPVAAPAVPFIPARGGGGAAAPNPVSSNPWSAMAEEFMTD
jgi:hypothetical protein